MKLRIKPSLELCIPFRASRAAPRVLLLLLCYMHVRCGQYAGPAWLSGARSASGDGRGAQQLFVERGVIFARIDSKLQATHPVCCILSSLGPDSLCMYTIDVLCGGSNSAGLFAA